MIEGSNRIGESWEEMVGRYFRSWGSIDSTPSLPHSPHPQRFLRKVKGKRSCFSAIKQSIILAEFFSLTNIVIQILYKAFLITEGIYHLLGETKFVKQIENIEILTVFGY